jgi:hypothetical protein
VKKFYQFFSFRKSSGFLLARLYIFMANVLNRFTLEYATSVDTSNYSPEVWVINPDLSAVEGLDKRQWVIEGDVVRAMTCNEQNKCCLGPAKLQKKSEIGDYREMILYSGFWWDGHVYETNDVSRANIIGTVAFILSGVPLPDGFTWRTGDDCNVPHTGPSFLAMFFNAIARLNTVYGISWYLKQQVDLMPDFDMVMNFDFVPYFPRVVIGHWPKDFEKCFAMSGEAECLIL